MALVEDMLKGNLVVALAVGGTALVLPKVLPHLSPPVRSLVKNGLSLFLECESEAEGGIIDKLADHALKGVLASLSSPDPPQDRQGAARAAVERFKHVAHTGPGATGATSMIGQPATTGTSPRCGTRFTGSGRVTRARRRQCWKSSRQRWPRRRARSLEENRRGNTGRRYEGGEPGRTSRSEPARPCSSRSSHPPCRNGCGLRPRQRCAPGSRFIAVPMEPITAAVGDLVTEAQLELAASSATAAPEEPSKPSRHKRREWATEFLTAKRDGTFRRTWWSDAP